MTRALIDTDILIYQIAAQCEKVIRWPGRDDDALWTRHAHLEEAIVSLEDMIQSVAQRAGADEFICPVTQSGRNWRYDCYADYKSNRKESYRPMLVSRLRDWVSDQGWGRDIPTLEADDVLGILQTKPGAGDTIICSIDKDMHTIPGRHFNFKDNEEFEVTEGEANRFHLLQALTGDVVDGYPGCPGVGPKTADKLLPATVESSDVAEVWREVIVPTYERKGMDEAFALSQAQVARILRAEDYDPKNKRVIYWRPYE